PQRPFLSDGCWYLGVIGTLRFGLARTAIGWRVPRNAPWLALCRTKSCSFGEPGCKRLLANIAIGASRPNTDARQPCERMVHVRRRSTSAFPGSDDRLAAVDRTFDLLWSARRCSPCADRSSIRGTRDLDSHDEL